VDWYVDVCVVAAGRSVAYPAWWRDLDRQRGWAHPSPACRLDGPSEWSPDGATVAFEEAGIVYLSRVDGTGERVLYRSAPECAFIDALRWSPDGSRLAAGGVDAFSFYPLRFCSGLVIVTIADATTISCDAEGEPLAWSPDSRRLAVDEAVVEDDPTQPESDLAVCDLLADKVWYPEPFTDLRWSPDKRHLVFVGPDAIYVARADGSHRRRIANAHHPIWSRDGRLLAFVYRGAIWTTRGEAPVQRRLGPGNSPSWSPDSRSIVFVRDAHIWRMRADGTRKLRIS
jgi:dipeptidyl aminopeptidase/acylaminoacyl peptidase